MPYNANIPQAADQLSQSQADILGNFQAIDTALDLTVGGVGIKFPRDAAVPPTGATSVGLYGFNSVLTPGTTALFFRNQNNGVSYDMTSSLKATPGWTCLPSGIILQWGNAIMPGGTANLVVNLPIAYPTAHLSVTATPNAIPAGLNTDIIMSVAVNAINSIVVQRKTHFGTACGFNYLSIGY